MILFQKENVTVINRMKRVLCCLAVVIFFSVPTMVFAQVDVDGLVAVGTAKSESMANRLRLTLTIKAKGSDMEKAIEVLKKRQKNAKIKMEKLGVIEDSIEFDSISSGGGGSRQVQIMQAMKNQARGDKRLEKMLKVKPPSSVKVTVSADWELDADLDEVEMLIAADKLKSKIIEADIESANEEDELSPAQEELAEEMAETASRYGNDEDSDGAKFFYVRTVAAEDVSKLVTDAVVDAREKAKQLAKITGVNLGPIYRVASDDSAEEVSVYNPYGGYQESSAKLSKTDDDGTLNAVSDSPMVSVSRTITFAFKIEE